jgi:thiol-disulfide isomerase/thioredoxin
MEQGLGPLCKIESKRSTHRIEPLNNQTHAVMKSAIRRFVLLLGSLVFVGAMAAAPFDRAAFDKLVAAGTPVVVQFHADWCPTCKVQAPIVEQVLADPKFKGVKLLVADFDSEKDLKKALRVSTQSTFVVFKGGKEVARSTGQTTRAAIEATFAKAL